MRKEGDDGRRVAGEGREEHRPGEGQEERPDHDRLLPGPLEEHPGRDGHDAVGDEESERQEGDQRQAEVEALDDVGDERPMMFVRSEMTKKVSRTRATMPRLRRAAAAGEGMTGPDGCSFIFGSCLSDTVLS